MIRIKHRLTGEVQVVNDMDGHPEDEFEIVEAFVARPRLNARRIDGRWVIDREAIALEQQRGMLEQLPKAFLAEWIMKLERRVAALENQGV